MRKGCGDNFCIWTVVVYARRQNKEHRNRSKRAVHSVNSVHFERKNLCSSNSGSKGLVRKNIRTDMLFILAKWTCQTVLTVDVQILDWCTQFRIMRVAVLATAVCLFCIRRKKTQSKSGTLCAWKMRFYSCPNDILLHTYLQRGGMIADYIPSPTNQTESKCPNQILHSAHCSMYQKFIPQQATVC